ncbi:MAG: DNA-binding domain-containing protein [Candidatus Binatia bacterium]
MLPLPELQSRFFRSLQAGKSADYDPAVVHLVQGREQLGPEERIDIYAGMYYARLLDALQQDFPRVTAILGFERFDEIARAYLLQHPSTHPSLRHIGRHFPAFLSTAAEGLESFPFLADLAQLEWTRLEMFDAPDAEPLHLAQLQTIPPAEWPGLRLHLIPACKILQSAWPVHEIWAAAAENRSFLDGGHPAETVIRVWRQDFTVYQASMDAVEQLALDRVHAREPFAAICATLESLLPSEEAACAVGSLLLRWIEDGILERR